MCVYVRVCRAECVHHAGGSSSWAQVLMAEVVCWRRSQVELVKDKAWPCRHDTETSPLWVDTHTNTGLKVNKTAHIVTIV